MAQVSCNALFLAYVSQDLFTFFFLCRIIIRIERVLIYLPGQIYLLELSALGKFDQFSINLLINWVLEILWHLGFIWGFLGKLNLLWFVHSIRSLLGVCSDLDRLSLI